MNGVAYHRITKGLSRPQLAKGANVNPVTIYDYENPNIAVRGNGQTYLRISNILGVSIDELLREDFPDIHDPFSEKRPRFKGDNRRNIVARYRAKQNLTLAELGVRLGNKTKEAARKACKSDVALDKHIADLAVYEGITIEEFTSKYGMEESA